MEAALHPLDGPRAKLVRAVQQADHLEAHCRAWVAANPHRLDCRFEDDAQYAYFRGSLPPRYLGLILGELVHNLRSSLDQLAWQLAISHVGEARLNEPEVGRMINFPITSSLENFRGHRAIPFFDPATLELMDKHQPYRNAETHLVNPLAIIHAWSNEDKHRTLTPALGRVDMDDLAFQTDAVIDIADVELLQPHSTVVDPAAPLLRIPAPGTARVEFRPVPAARISGYGSQSSAELNGHWVDSRPTARSGCDVPDCRGSGVSTTAGRVLLDGRARVAARSDSPPAIDEIEHHRDSVPIRESLLARE